MEKCKCYHEVPSSPSLGIIGRCYGTKERDVCSCGGDESKCDFYPEKRAAAEEKVKAEFSKTCDMNAKELLGCIIDEVATRRNINALVYLNDDSIHISIYPYEEDE